MARVSLGRVLAVFFVSALMALAILYFFAMPVKLANAQSMHRVFDLECTGGMVDPDDPRFTYLSPDQASAYIEEAARAYGHNQNLDDEVSARVLVLRNGFAAFQPIFEGRECRPLTIGPEGHAAGMAAAMREPV